MITYNSKGRGHLMDLFLKWMFSIGIFLFTWKIETQTMRATGSLKLQKGEHGLLNPSMKINKQVIFFNYSLILQYISWKVFCNMIHQYIFFMTLKYGSKCPLIWQIPVNTALHNYQDVLRRVNASQHKPILPLYFAHISSSM